MLLIYEIYKKNQRFAATFEIWKHMNNVRTWHQTGTTLSNLLTSGSHIVQRNWSQVSTQYLCYNCHAFFGTNHWALNVDFRRPSGQGPKARGRSSAADQRREARQDPSSSLASLVSPFQRRGNTFRPRGEGTKPRCLLRGGPTDEPPSLEHVAYVIFSSFYTIFTTIALKIGDT
jgi:hypothetical protein